jgi:putative pyruvate formate lyase activating enzyme
VEPDRLAGIMLELQEQGCHNINVVTPSHVVPQILEALVIAAKSGLHIPLAYNSSGYDHPQTLEILDGVVDIYMPDYKFADDSVGKRYTQAGDYGEVARAAIREMQRQVGELILDHEGVAVRGLLVRHLVMPGQLEQTEAILQFLAEEISTDTYLNLMDQYRPCFQADRYPEINRGLKVEEYDQALTAAKTFGLGRLSEENWSLMIRRLFAER